MTSYALAALRDTGAREAALHNAAEVEHSTKGRLYGMRCYVKAALRAGVAAHNIRCDPDSAVGLKGAYTQDMVFVLAEPVPALPVPARPALPTEPSSQTQPEARPVLRAEDEGQGRKCRFC